MNKYNAYKKKLKELNEDIFCEQCGASLDIEDDVCPYCNRKRMVYKNEYY